MKPLALLALAVCGTLAQGEERVVEGVCPAVSPDGAHVAFHRFEDGVMNVGVCPAAGGAVRWIESGPAMAAYPVWSPDGALVYTYGREKGTAYEVYKGLAKPEGYGLRVREANGAVRELCTGYTRDYLPSLSPDGRTVYFSTTREVKSPQEQYSLAMSANIARVPLDGSAVPEVVMKPLATYNAGLVQPVLSPDGKLMAYQDMRTFDPDGWCVSVVRMDRLNVGFAARVTPRLMSALAPRWHPAGRYLAFTGFLPDDPGWGVWILDTKSFGMMRLANGENPAFSPDGRWIYYDRDRTVYRKSLVGIDLSALPEVAEAKDSSPRTERRVWSCGRCEQETVACVTGADFAVDSDDAVVVRARVRWNGTADMQMFFIGEYGESGQGILLYLGKEKMLWFASRDRKNRFAGVSVSLDTAGTYDLIGVRANDRCYLSVNGAPPHAAGLVGSLRLMNPRAFVVGRGLAGGCAVESVSFGRGWPAEFKTNAELRKEVFK